MVTIKQIAELAGVSRGTVDRVLNDRGAVNADTAQRIREIATALQYTPNRAGKTLAVRKKGLRFGYIMFKGEKNPFFNQVLEGVEKKTRELSEFGITVDIHKVSFGDFEHQVEILRMMSENSVSGIAITPVNHPLVAEQIRRLTDLSIPVITVNSDIENANRLAYVGTDDYRSGRTAGSLMGLITNGQAKVGAVIGSHSILCHTERLRGFCHAAKAHYPEIELVETVENHDDDVESFAVTSELLQKHPDLDALYLAAAGAYGACKAVQAQNLEHKLKIISFDSVPTTRELVRKGIIAATIEQQPWLQGAKPLDLLFNYLALDTPPKQEQYFTEIQIKIRENISQD